MNLYRNVILLAVAQACYLATSMTVVTYAAQAAALFAPSPSLATLPVTLSIVATALTTAPMSILMQRRSRRFGFRLGACSGALGGLLAAYAIQTESFLLLCVATTLVGPFQASAQYYRFAAAESMPAPMTPRAISLVLIGGLVAAALMPVFTGFFGELFAPNRFVGPFVFAALAVAFVLVPVAFLRPVVAAFTGDAQDTSQDLVRPMRAVISQGGFIVAVINAALGFAMMSFVMTATPLAMELYGIGADSPSVIRNHVIAMYLPSLFTGFLIQRFGLFPILIAGHIAFAVAFLVALSGVGMTHFSVALIALGVGWNFCFVGGTTLLTRIHTPAEKGRVQGLNEFLVFSTTGVASFAAGLILNLYGWQTINRAGFLMLALATGATLLWGVPGWVRRARRSG